MRGARAGARPLARGPLPQHDPRNAGDIAGPADTAARRRTRRARPAHPLEFSVHGSRGGSGFETLVYETAEPAGHPPKPPPRRAAGRGTRRRRVAARFGSQFQPPLPAIGDRRSRARCVSVRRHAPARKSRWRPACPGMGPSARRTSPPAARSTHSRARCQPHRLWEPVSQSCACAPHGRLGPAPANGALPCPPARSPARGSTPACRALRAALPRTCRAAECEVARLGGSLTHNPAWRTEAKRHSKLPAPGRRGAPPLNSSVARHRSARAHRCGQPRRYTGAGAGRAVQARGAALRVSPRTPPQPVQFSPPIHPHDYSGALAARDLLYRVLLGRSPARMGAPRSQRRALALSVPLILLLAVVGARAEEGGNAATPAATETKPAAKTSNIVPTAGEAVLPNGIGDVSPTGEADLGGLQYRWSWNVLHGAPRMAGRSWRGFN